MCNPFMACGGCAGYTLASAPTFTTVEFAFATLEKNIHQENLHSQFSPDFWQPPKIG